MTALLRIDDLAVEFVTPDRRNTALDGISLEIGVGEVVGLVGETGCGKTLTGLSILGLLPPSASITRGSIEFEGRDHDRARGRGVARASVATGSRWSSRTRPRRSTRCSRSGPRSASVLAAHGQLSRADAESRIAEVLHDVGLGETDRVLRSYPHQLSGGMLQRAMIAMALVSRPALLIADEPTTALDVTIAAQILRLLRRLQEEQGFSVLFITHDLGVVRTVSDRVVVLYAGRIAENARTADLFRDPRSPVHPRPDGGRSASVDPWRRPARDRRFDPGGSRCDRRLRLCRPLPDRDRALP